MWAEANAQATACARTLNQASSELGDVIERYVLRLEDMFDSQTAMEPVQAVLRAVGLQLPDSVVRSAVREVFRTDLGATGEGNDAVRGVFADADGADASDTAPGGADSEQRRPPAVASRYGKWRALAQNDPLWFAVLHEEVSETLAMFGYA
jgi:hypothetical protein